MQISIGIFVDNDGKITLGNGVNLPKTERRNKGKSIVDFPQDYCVVDIETTGLSPQCDEIIEIAAIKYSNGKMVDSFQSLLQPLPFEDEGNTCYVNDFITKLTGITNQMLANALRPEEVLPVFDKFLGDSIIVGYNVNFDVNFLYDAFDMYLGKKLRNDFIDVMRMAKKLHPELEHHRLIDMTNIFCLKNENAHRAFSDCLVTESCYEKLRTEAKVEYGSLSEFCRSFLRDRVRYVNAKNIVGDPAKIDIDSLLFGKNIVFTGLLKRLSRTEAMQVVADLGGINQNNVTKKTNYLVLGNNDYCSTIKDGKSNKQKKAEEYRLKGLDIEIISENVFYDMIAEAIDEQL